MTTPESGPTVDQSKDESVPPRMVNQETIELIKHPISKYERTPVDFQLMKIIAIVLKAQGFHVTNDFLTQLNELSLIYFHNLIETLKKFTELQRRTTPSVNDLKLSFQLRNISYNNLYLQYKRNEIIYARHQPQIDSTNQQTNDMINSLHDITYDPSSESFFNIQEYEITELVPRETKRPNYIPNYFPDLPPDYTFKNTARYIEPLKDMEKLRLKLVEQSRLTEQSLYDIIGDDENEWKKNLDIDISEDESHLSLSEVPMMESPPSKFDDVKPPELPEYAVDSDEEDEGVENVKEVDKKFDFVAYAAKRHHIRQRKMQDIIDKRTKRQNNLYMKAEKYFSPYASLPITHDTRKFFKDNLQQELSNVIHAVRVGEKRQKVAIDELLQEKAKLAKVQEKERETIEFGFNFGDNNNNHFDSDSDSDGEHLNANEVIFATDKPEESTVPSNGPSSELNKSIHEIPVQDITTQSGPTDSPHGIEFKATMDTIDNSDDDLAADLEDVFGN